MAEPTLNAAYQDLQADVGLFLGYGRGVAFSDPVWDAQQAANIERCVKGGIRKVYFCGYDWSFLRPVASVALAQGARTAALPDDFGGVEGQITLTAATTVFWYPLDTVGVGAVYRREAEQNTTTGRPLLCCVEPLKGTTLTASSRCQLHLWPVADQAYTLKFAYYLNPDYLTGSFPWLYGGAQHAETFLAACKATAELDLDDVGGGPQQAEFARLLALSQDMDRRLKPQALGMMTDHSDRPGRWRTRHGDAVVTYMGVLPG